MFTVFKPLDEKAENEQKIKSELDNIQQEIESLRDKYNTVFESYWKHFLPCAGGEMYPDRDKNLDEKLRILTQVRSELDELKTLQDQIGNSII